MRHAVKWNNSNLNIRCWSCGEILIAISTDGNVIEFESMPKYIEIICTKCHSCCEYSFQSESEDGWLLLSHNWDPDIDRRNFIGNYGKRNKEFLKQYKLYINKLQKADEIFKKEFDIVGDFLEFLSENNEGPHPQNPASIENYLNEFDYRSKNSKEVAKRALNRFYKLIA